MLGIHRLVFCQPWPKIQMLFGFNAMKDSIWNRNSAKFVKECKRLRALCHRIIAGEHSVIEGSRRMCRYRFAMREEKNKMWDIFVTVDAQSHHLPIGDVRQYWNKEALEKKDEEVKLVEDFYRDRVLNAAQKISDEYAGYIAPPTGPSN